MENGLVYSTLVRTHASAAGATNNSTQAEQSLRQGSGDFSTKIHVIVHGLGYPLRLYLTAGHRHDIIKAYDLIAHLGLELVIPDRMATRGCR